MWGQEHEKCVVGGGCFCHTATASACCECQVMEICISCLNNNVHLPCTHQHPEGSHDTC